MAGAAQRRALGQCWLGGGGSQAQSPPQHTAQSEAPLPAGSPAGGCPSHSTAGWHPAQIPGRGASGEATPPERQPLSHLSPACDYGLASSPDSLSPSPGAPALHLLCPCCTLQGTSAPSHFLLQEALPDHPLQYLGWQAFCPRLSGRPVNHSTQSTVLSPHPIHSFTEPTCPPPSRPLGHKGGDSSIHALWPAPHREVPDRCPSPECPD